MDRTVTRSLPIGDVTVLDLPLPSSGQVGSLSRLVPLWRYVAWMVALFVVLSFWVQVRVDVQALREDLDKAGRAQREARITNDRLRLELDARRRAVALEDVARRMGLGENARVVRVVP